jgi:DNA repair ATPase RecN
MLISLYVKDFAIVGKAEIAFGAGLTVVTGETGAGKSLLVDALLLLTGGRADSGCVRHGCERAELVAEFDLTDAPQAKTWLSEEALDDDGHCQRHNRHQPGKQRSPKTKLIVYFLLQRFFQVTFHAINWLARNRRGLC